LSSIRLALKVSQSSLTPFIIKRPDPYAVKTKQAPFTLAADAKKETDDATGMTSPPEEKMRS
jgi:hypothetical protein